ncbi:MAG: hypothetical protein IJD04_04100 [Desulfovibrionaceae bacterium]|nr:hypothetical protein [Desulfovibrionaceae bacterium]
MSNPDNLKRTALYNTHLGLGGNMVNFGGWEMPLWYKTGAVKEHMAVIKAAGLFDTSHMSVITVEGREVKEFLNFALTRDISEQRPGRCGYSAILTADGFCLDDTIIYPLTEERTALVVNAGMGAKVIEHMRTLPGGDALSWSDLTAKVGKLDIQGPLALKILKDLIKDADQIFEKFPYFSFKGDFDFSTTRVFMSDGTPIVLSRTGYTGEFGFEIYLPAERAAAVWGMLLKAGEPFGLIPCGLAARDSLRAGAVLALSHQDIGGWPFINHPWPWALPLAENGEFTKDFYGKEALNTASTDYTIPFAGYDPRKVDTETARVFYEGEDIGLALTCVADMAIGRVDGKIVSVACPDAPENFNPRGLVCGFVKVNRPLEAGSKLILKDNRREISVEAVVDIRPCRTARKKLDSML